MEAYGIFEGGGARAYAHIGALKAAEDRGIVFRTVAGTSAGAIIAALVAAGYNADELLDFFAEPPSGALAVDPFDILSRTEYDQAKPLLDELGRFAKQADPGSKKAKATSLWDRWKRSFWLPLIAPAYLAIRHRRALRRLFDRFGLNDIERVADWLETLLQAKVAPAHGGAVQFGDLTTGLRVVAADLSGKSLRTFGVASDAALPVARAVAASACYPLFFEPLRIDDRLYVDGGIVSNLPAWSLDDERDADFAFLPTFGFRLPTALSVESASGLPSGPLDFVKQLLATMQTGAAGLQHRKIDDYYAIDLTPDIGSLAFDALPERAAPTAREGYDCVIAHFEMVIGPQDPIRMAAVLRRANGLLRDRYDGRRFRSSVLLPDPSGGPWARTAYSAGMERDGDDRVKIRSDSTIGCGAAFSRREPIYVRRPRVDFAVPGNRYELAIRPERATYFYANPMFQDLDEWLRDDPAQRAEPFAVLVIDTDQSMDDLLNDPDEQDALANLAAIIGAQVSGQPTVRTRHGEAGLSGSPVGSTAIDPAGGFLVSNRKPRDIGDTTGERSLSQAMGVAISMIDSATPSRSAQPAALQARLGADQ